MNDNKTTLSKRPMPARPENGWKAWEATIGYITVHHSPDATLTLKAYPRHGITLWDATLTWGQHSESVTECIGIEVALADLWRVVARFHRIFKTLEDAARRPELYADDEWLDTATLEAVSRLVGVSATVFGEDWFVLLSYRPVDVPQQRVQARLAAHAEAVARGGMGATLREACRTLFHNTTPDYKQYMSNPLDL